MSDARPPRDSLGEILTLQHETDGASSARLESFWGATVVGDLLGRAVLAAAPGAKGPLRSLQASLLGPADPDSTLQLACERLGSDGARVEIQDSGARLASVVLRFGPETSGLTYQSAGLDAGLPAPESLPSEAETAEREGWGPYAVGPIESRRISPYEAVKDHEPAVWLGWLRPRVALDDDPWLHAAALAFVSEYRSHWALERRLGPAFPSTELTLLDHALWVHRPERWNDWWLVRTESDVGVGGRCLSRRGIFTRSGALVASAAWQHEVRERD